MGNILERLVNGYLQWKKKKHLPDSYDQSPDMKNVVKLAQDR